MKSLQPIYPRQLRGIVQLPASKSISARALVISALAGRGMLSNLSDCDDTQVLQQALQQRLPEIDIMAAGTAMRFLTAYFATCDGEIHVLTGSERMRQRPIKVLVDALRKLGAEIEYEGKEGYPPLRIQGKKLHGGTVELPANVSSQYISALLMIGPVLDEGLNLRLIGEVISRPYIEMTVGLMQKFGAEVQWISDNELIVRSHPYQSGLSFDVEADWSAASYWYEMMALTSDDEARIALPGLYEDSWQGDSVVSRLFESFGVHTTYEAGAAILTKSILPTSTMPLELDFTSCPDLAQTLVVTSAMLGRPFRFEGLQSLRIKETDRVLALQEELQKVGIRLLSRSSSAAAHPQEKEILEMSASPCLRFDVKAEFLTYDDHRMAMAFAPVAMRFPNIRIAHPEVVSKSYPAFWADLEKLGVSFN